MSMSTTYSICSQLQLKNSKKYHKFKETVASKDHMMSCLLELSILSMSIWDKKIKISSWKIKEIEISSWKIDIMNWLKEKLKKIVRYLFINLTANFSHMILNDQT